MLFATVAFQQIFVDVIIAQRLKNVEVLAAEDWRNCIPCFLKLVTSLTPAIYYTEATDLSPIQTLRYVSNFEAAMFLSRPAVNASIVTQPLTKLILHGCIFSFK